MCTKKKKKRFTNKYLLQKGLWKGDGDETKPTSKSDFKKTWKLSLQPQQTKSPVRMRDLVAVAVPQHPRDRSTLKGSKL